MTDRARRDAERSVTEAQRDALGFLAAIFGDPTYVNASRPSIAVHADYEPCDAYPFGASFRVEPDGAVDDITQALIGGE